MRITGLATGLDMDELVKSTMKPYRIKIQQQQQKQEVLEIKQKLYRDVIGDCRDFYNKYFDVSKTDSILLSKNWATTKFTSSDDSIVSVSAGSDAKVGNYTVKGNKATATKATLTEGIAKGETVVVNGKEFTFKGADGKEIAKNLNTELKESGIGVTVKYTDFAGTTSGSKSGLVFESTTLGSGGSFTIGGKAVKVEIENKNGKDDINAKVLFDKDSIEKLKTANSITIDGKTIDLGLKPDEEYSNSDLTKIVNEKLKENNSDYTVSIDKDNNLIFTSNTTGSGIADPIILIDSVKGDFTDGENGTKTSSSMNLDDVKGKTIYINGKAIDIPADLSIGTSLDEVNKALEKQDIIASIDGDRLVLTAKDVGSKQTIDISVIDKSVGQVPNVIQGDDANITIEDGSGGVYLHKGDSNTVTLDGITFKFDGEIPEEGIKINGKSDVTAIKDKLVAFVNDYNTVIGKLNTLISEKRDSTYMPLTDEQRESMSESEIKLWEERVEKGQLKRDSDLTRIANSMKNAMRTVMGSNNLEKFGIKPYEDYSGTKNGTFTIDEQALTKALETNGEELMNLFIGNNSDSKGIGQQLKTILYEESVSSLSPLIKKAGLEGTASVSNNELTTKIEKYKQKIEDMEDSFSVREQALYSKWATIETLMNNLNAQQSSLASMLG